MARTEKLRFKFRTEVVCTDGGMRTHLLLLPDEFADAWKAAKVRRLVGTLNGVEINRGIQNTADGARFLVMNKNLLKEIGAREGDTVEADLRPDPAPDNVEVPDEFLMVLEQDPEAKARWETFKPGLRRSAVHYIASAKREDTRIRRAVEIAEKIKDRSLYGDSGR